MFTTWVIFKYHICYVYDWGDFQVLFVATFTTGVGISYKVIILKMDSPAGAATEPRNIVVFPPQRKHIILKSSE